METEVRVKEEIGGPGEGSTSLIKNEILYDDDIYMFEDCPPGPENGTEAVWIKEEAENSGSDSDIAIVEESWPQVSAEPVEAPKKRIEKDQKAPKGKKSRKAKEPGISCPRCGLIFKSEASLEAHFFIHTGEKPLGCPFCPKNFKFREMLNDHIETLHAKESFCERCTHGEGGGGMLGMSGQVRSAVRAEQARSGGARSEAIRLQHVPSSFWEAEPPGAPQALAHRRAPVPVPALLREVPAAATSQDAHARPLQARQPTLELHRLPGQVQAETRPQGAPQTPRMRGDLGRADIHTHNTSGSGRIPNIHLAREELCPRSIRNPSSQHSEISFFYNFIAT
ncbi:unnamed protein product [Bemisia tabaci]|uniref:C2H2-type domain-containing protein n=1 Tax=Bemisia tabaci TaxID=7038 RepID=A0A9P0AKW3_BEMTA|nr:unnamed protein product [Bemisia tabaci]